MKRTSLITIAMASLLAVTACGTSQKDRALSGAGIGAGAGAVGGALVGHPVEGALLGGAAGGATGAFTSPNSVNLGRPAWR